MPRSAFRSFLLLPLLLAAAAVSAQDTIGVIRVKKKFYCESCDSISSEAVSPVFSFPGWQRIWPQAPGRYRLAFKNSLVILADTSLNRQRWIPSAVEYSYVHGKTVTPVYVRSNFLGDEFMRLIFQANKGDRLIVEAVWFDDREGNFRRMVVDDAVLEKL